MTIHTVRNILAALLTALPAAADAPAAEVPVSIAAVCGPLGDTLFRAKFVVVKVFAGAGIRLRWTRPSDPEAIWIEIACTAPEGTPQGALAMTRLYTRDRASITAFQDRILAVHRSPRLIAPLLGYVLAHELGHRLQGIERHSETGIMKPSWTPADYDQMGKGLLAFTQLDIQLIHAGLRKVSPTFPVASAPQSR